MWIMLVIIGINCGFKLTKALFSVDKENTSFHLPSLQGVSVSYSKDGFQVEYYFTSSSSTLKWCEHNYSSYHPQGYKTMTVTTTTNTTITTIPIATAVKISHYNYFV